MSKSSNESASISSKENKRDNRKEYQSKWKAARKRRAFWMTGRSAEEPTKRGKR